MRQINKTNIHNLQEEDPSFGASFAGSVVAPALVSGRTQLPGSEPPDAQTT